MNIKRIFGKKLVKNAMAVSPIIATLMLVLVAVGSAGAFYVWQSGWQSGIEDKVSGSGELQASLSIGGSSTVYEFTAVAGEYYMVANPNYKISYQSGGSGAGIAAVGTGAIDIGSASKPLTTEDKNKYPDLNKDGVKDYGRELVEHTVAWDAVAVVVSDDNFAAHGLISIDELDLAAVYYANSGAVPADIPGDVQAGITALDIVTPDGIIQWDELFETPTHTISCVGAGDVTIYDRDDKSGTEEVFSKKIIDTDEKELETAGIDTTNGAGNSGHYKGNQNLLTAIAKDPDALSFMSYGMAKAGDSGLKMIPFQGDHDTDPVTPSEDSIMMGAEEDGAYDGARPINYITVGEATGDVKVYIDFCLQTEINQDICEVAGYISIYAYTH